MPGFTGVRKGEGCHDVGLEGCRELFHSFSFARRRRDSGEVNVACGEVVRKEPFLLDGEWCCGNTS